MKVWDFKIKYGLCKRHGPCLWQTLSLISHSKAFRHFSFVCVFCQVQRRKREKKKLKLWFRVRISYCQDQESFWRGCQVLVEVWKESSEFLGNFFENPLRDFKVKIRLKCCLCLFMLILSLSRCYVSVLVDLWIFGKEHVFLNVLDWILRHSHILRHL